MLVNSWSPSAACCWFSARGADCFHSPPPVWDCNVSLSELSFMLLLLSFSFREHAPMETNAATPMTWRSQMRRKWNDDFFFYKRFYFWTLNGRLDKMRIMHCNRIVFGWGQKPKNSCKMQNISIIQFHVSFFVWDCFYVTVVSVQ